MNLEEKVRKAFNRPVKESKVNRYDPDEQPNLYELYNYLRKAGYRLVDVLDQGEKYPEILIEPVKEDNVLYPQIEHDYLSNEFSMLTEYRGTLGISDVELLIQGYENALGVLRYLESLDISKLEYEREETED